MAGLKTFCESANGISTGRNVITLKTPVRLPKGTRIETEIAYDNSKDNPNNPNSPPHRVTFGQQSTDEMGSMSIEFAAVRERDLLEYASAAQEHLQSSVAGGLRDVLARRRGRRRSAVKRERNTRSTRGTRKASIHLVPLMLLVFLLPFVLISYKLAG